MAQTLTRLLTHVVYSTKERAPFIAPSLQPHLYSYMGGISSSMESPLLAAGGVEDHVHLLISQSKNHALSEVVMHIKRGSSRWMKEQGVPRFAWQGGYCGFSIGRSQVESLQGYFARQAAHHRRRSFQDEIRELLQRYGVECDERYLWQ